MKYNTIKKISFAVMLGLLIVAVLPSCESDVIDLSPVDRLSDETVYSTPERCEMAIIGMYDAAQSGYYKGNDARRGYPFGSASILQSDMRGADMMNMASFFLITYNNSISMTSANNVSMWENSFAAINRANVVLAGIEGAIEEGVLTKEQGDQYIGECLFIRALTYSNLMIHFTLPYGVTGNNNYGLPYYEKAINTQEVMDESLQMDRSTVEATYTKMFADLNKAEQLLPDVNPVNKITRASKGAAIGIKTRLSLWKKDWKGVITEAKKMVTGTESFTSPIGGYKLEGSPETPFTSYTANSESIFSIENSTDDNSTVNGSVGQMMSTRPGGRQLVAMSPILYNSTWWLEDDLRRETLTMKASTGFVFADKYQRPVEQDEYAPIIRYAEVLLNYAEAAVRDNDAALALSLLNAVRNRSVTDEADYYTSSSFPTNKDLLEAILWERRIEFFAEGRRWEDIHRLINDPDFDTKGIPAKTSPSKVKKENFGIGLPVGEELLLTSPIPYTDRRFLWPIPQDDVIRNSTVSAQQNAGW
ncbi:MAG: RagB/SusD family nutrient uptake outer membrane protein [Dysgonamonadaceae bacterium]|jgi:hypothetical protein